MRGFTLNISGIETRIRCRFFSNQEKMLAYVKGNLEMSPPDDATALACGWVKPRKTALMIFHMEEFSRYIFGHESFHTTLGVMRMEAGSPTFYWGDFVVGKKGHDEEECSDLLGAIHAEFWPKFFKKFKCTDNNY